MIRVDPFTLFDRNWALLTAGTADDFNTMTISWGMLGTLWGKPAATVYVRESRYTLAFLEKYDWFSISFFDEEWKKDLGILGTVSGRDENKIAMTKLTPVPVGEDHQVMGFAQAKMTLICRKMYQQGMDPGCIPPDVRQRFYADFDFHRMFVGEVTEVEAA
ncbi:flavin reductase [uncultured Faecalibaculum sp.]|uniref:flavin reductase n=1 Tax=uncultured Faecalibaculum sp. TaxID=1729681 RepID=UPI002636E855|nr:flavin reductase [uncultured Faecalibaculum sp.]